MIYKGNDNYYLEATIDHADHPAAAATLGGSARRRVRHGRARRQHAGRSWRPTYDGTTSASTSTAPGVATPAHRRDHASPNPLQIGGDSIYGQFFTGLIDEVRVYNTALTAAQIQADMARRDRSSRRLRASLTATAVTPTQVDLSWGASTDTAGVSGYRVERCQGAGCSNFTQIATPTGTTLQRHGPDRQHQLQLPRPRGRQRRATLGAYSNTATGVHGLDRLAPRTATLTFTRDAAVHGAGPGSGSRDLVGRRRHRRDRQRRDDHDRRPLHAADERRHAHRDRHGRRPNRPARPST